MTPKLLADIEKGTKGSLTKKKIIQYYLHARSSTIPDLAKELELSIPTVAKFLNDMIKEGVIANYGKQEAGEGRPPALYGLNPQAGYFVGVDIKKFSVDVALMDLMGDVVTMKEDIPLLCENTEAYLDALCQTVREFIGTTQLDHDRLLNICVNISGRVNPQTGFSHILFNFDERPLAQVLTEKMGYPVCIDNDTRAMAYGEMMKGVVKDEQNIIFINISWGLGAGLILNGDVYMGKSGFSGEFGHFNVFDNEIICHCGKRGCLETEVSGAALYRNLFVSLKEGKQSILSKLIDEGKQPLTLKDIVCATNREDVLCIELVEEIGQKLGRYLAGLINLLNPELVVVGGVLAETGDYLLQPAITAMRKYSLNLVNRDTAIVLSQLGPRCGVIGACLLARKKRLE